MKSPGDLFILDKAIWTEQDYEQMGWHDCNIYGFAFLPVDKTDTTNLAFDIDYIFKWVNPVPPDARFSFWASPCTLLFKDTFALTINIDRREGTIDMLEIADLILLDKVQLETNQWVYEWKMELQEGTINFKSMGFDQFVRQKPILTSSQVLMMDERKGISFKTTPVSL